MKNKRSYFNLRKASITAVLVIFSVLAAFDQQKRITVNISNQPLNKALEQIGKQAGMNIAYSKEFVKSDSKISVSVNN